MGQIRRPGSSLAVEPCNIDDGTGFALQAGLHGIHPGKALHIGAVNSSDVIAHHDTGFLRRRVLIYPGHSGIAGLVHAKFHANAHHLAALLVHQLGVGVGGVVTGVLVAGTQQVACGQAVVQHRFINGVVVVAAHIAVHLGHFVVHAFLFLHAAHRAVKQTHGNEHGNGKGHGHGKDHNGDSHAHRDLTVHACPSLLIQQQHDHTAQQRECKHACQNKAADTQPALVFLFVHRIPDSL